MTARSKRIRLALGALALLLVPTVLFAVQRHAGPGAGGGMLQRAVERLDLTPDQVAQIKDILRTHQQEVEAEIAVVATARRALFNAIHADAPNATAIRAAATKVGSAEGNLAVTRSVIAQEVRGVLTSEQQAELKTMLADGQAFVQDFFSRIQQRFTDFVG